MQLQKFGIKESRYERPTHKWVCGRLSEGRPCVVGPDEQGACSASVECFPLREGDRWKCTRDQLRGGKCSNGPLPDGSCSRRVPQCLPLLSLRRKRGMITRWSVLLSLAAILIALTSSSRLTLVSPGHLSMQHGTSGGQCEGCHSVSSGSPADWIANAALNKHDKVKESGLCIKCHDFGKNALNPHSQDSSNLSEIRRRLKNLGDRDFKPMRFSLINFVPAKTAQDDPILSCATCHREHRGENADLTEVGDLQCQSCHLVKFDRFSEGHPDIAGFSFQRRPRIIFDHQAHKAKYYPDEKNYPGDKRQFLCADCHHVDAKGEAMSSPDFDKGCRNCHSAEIEGRGGSEHIGLAVLSVPGLDIETLKARNIAVGEWPRFADSKITPFMSTLLSTDPAYHEAQAALVRIRDLLDLRNENSDDLHAVQKLAWSVKKLLFDLNSQGQAALETRIKSIFGEEMTEDSLSAIVGGLSAGAFSSAQQKWFPNLAAEMEQYDANSPPPASFTNSGEDQSGEAESPAETAQEAGSESKDESVDFDLSAIEVSVDDFDLSNIEVDESDADGNESAAAEEDRIPAEKWVRSGGWYHQNFSLLYRPKGHADRFVKRWLDVAADKTPASSDLFKALSDPKSPGKCMKCHSIDRNSQDAYEINWYGRKPEPEVHEFTNFSHRPHFSLIESRGCITCHAWNDQADVDFSTGYEQYDPLSYTSNFSVLSKQTCAECHTGGAASESCLTCHNYHVGKFPDLMHSIKTQ